MPQSLARGWRLRFVTFAYTVCVTSPGPFCSISRYLPVFTCIHHRYLLVFTTPDVLLHETAVAMFRNRLRREKPVVLPWDETQEQWTERAEKVVRWMNRTCNLDSLCRKFPERLQQVVEKEGERLVRN